MITDQTGTPVQLATPIDWSNGWTSVVYPGDSTKAPHDMHVIDLVADGGMAELEAASHVLEPHLCKDCGQPMQMDIQERRDASPLLLVTCKNRDCSLWSVTLTTLQYAALTEDQWTAYRQSTINLKAFLADWGKK